MTRIRFERSATVRSPSQPARCGLPLVPMKATLQGMGLLTALDVPGPVEKWRALGFACDDGGFTLGHVRFRVGQDEQRWSFEELGGDASLLGVPTSVEPAPAKAAAHANLIDEIDHVVYAVPVLDDAI